MCQVLQWGLAFKLRTQCYDDDELYPAEQLSELPGGGTWQSCQEETERKTNQFHFEARNHLKVLPGTGPP